MDVRSSQRGNLVSVQFTEEDVGAVMKAVPRALKATLAFAQSTVAGGGAHTKVVEKVQQELQTYA